MIGSLRKVWPWKELPGADGLAIGDVNVLPAAFTSDVALVIALMLVGAAAVLVIEFLGADRSADRGAKVER